MGITRTQLAYLPFQLRRLEEVCRQIALRTQQTIRICVAILIGSDHPAAV
jgi:hypothetical protein